MPNSIDADEPTPSHSDEETILTAEQATEVTVESAVLTDPPIEAEETEAPPSATGEAVNEDSKAELLRLAETSSTTRLPPADEEKMSRLAKECLLSGRAGVSAVVEALPKMPWILGVRAVEASWADLSSGFRTQLLSGLGKIETDAARRVRLSIARSLARIDLPVGLKLAGAVCKEMWDKDTNTLSPENSKVVGNVFIGRGKPWILQLPLADLKPAEADAVLHCVVASAFNFNNPPITQLSILRYASQDGRLGKLDESLIALIAKTVGRWNGKWQNALKTEITDLPEAISSVLTAPPPPANPPQQNQPRKERERPPQKKEPVAEPQEIPLPPELEEKLQMAAETEDVELLQAVTQEVNAWREVQRVALLEKAAEAENDLDDDDEDEEDDDDGDVEEAAERSGGNQRQGRGRDRGRGKNQKERPAYVSREQERAASSGGNFDFGNSLKQIESYVRNLKNDLVQAQSRLRRTEDESRRGGGARKDFDKAAPVAGDAHLSPEELQRLNAQLEGRIAELQQRLEDLTADSEARAVSMAAGSEENPPDAKTQLCTLLAIKLEEDYADFLALDKEAPDIIVQQHYRDLIRHVFAVLAEEGVALKAPATLSQRSER